MTYSSIETLLDRLPAPNRAACRAMLEAERALFQSAYGSTHNHQAWPGGYYDHIQEVMNIAVLLYDTMKAVRPLPFSLDEALLVLFLHDLEKPWKYEVGDDGVRRHSAEMQGKDAHQTFRVKKLRSHGIQMSDEQCKTLKYVEGELDDYTNSKRVMSPLAAFCHMCDVASARLWYDHPKPEADPWDGASRINTQGS